MVWGGGGRPGAEAIKLFMLNLTEHEIIMLINVKVATIFGILTFNIMINATSERLKAKVFIFQHLIFMRSLNFILNELSIIFL